MEDQQNKSNIPTDVQPNLEQTQPFQPAQQTVSNTDPQIATNNTAVRDWIITALLALTFIGLPLAIIFIVWRQPKLGKKVKLIITGIVCLLLIAVGVIASSSKSSNGPALSPETELKASVKTRKVVGVLSDYTVENNNNADWTNCTLTAGNIYSQKIDKIPAFGSKIFDAKSFKDEKENAFNPLKEKNHTLTIECSLNGKIVAGSYGK